MFLEILLVIMIVALLGGIYLGRRNKKVFEYRRDILDRMQQALIAEQYDDEDVNWRLQEFNAVSYEAMIYKFWKPVDEFYPRDPARPER